MPHSITCLYECPEHVLGGYKDQAMAYLSNASMEMEASTGNVIRINPDRPEPLLFYRIQPYFTPLRSPNCRRLPSEIYSIPSEPYRALRSDCLLEIESSQLALSMIGRNQASA